MAQLFSASKTTSRLAILLAIGWATSGATEAAHAQPAADTSSPKQSGADTDRDGLSDAREREIGSDPNDADSDDDGWLDGQEKHPDGDADHDGKINVLDPDSDNDFLWDGLEIGTACSDPDTRRVVHACKPDSDSGDTQTDPLDPDTDGDGLLDGEEDFIHNGIVDEGERDPLNGPRTGGDEPVKNDDQLQGGGFACSATRAGASGGSALALLTALAVTLGARRRRR